MVRRQLVLALVNSGQKHKDLASDGALCAAAGNAVHGPPKAFRELRVDACRKSAGLGSVSPIATLPAAALIPLILALSAACAVAQGTARPCPPDIPIYCLPPPKPTPGGGTIEIGQIFDICPTLPPAVVGVLGTPSDDDCPAPPEPSGPGHVLEWVDPLKRPEPSMGPDTIWLPGLKEWALDRK